MKSEIKTALEECRAAFTANQDAKSVWCCHHETLWEPLTEHYEKRIWFILDNKPPTEHLVRFQNFRPCTQPDAVMALDADYKAKRAPLFADYKAKCAPLFADYKAKRAPLFADYKAKRAPLFADYEAKRAPLFADYEAKRAPLFADYEAKRAPLYHADVPLGTWNGKSIFA